MGSSEQDRVWAETQASPEFQDLKRKFRGFAFPLTVAFLVWYFLYVALTAFAREWVSTPVVGNINIAFILGVLQFATTFLIMCSTSVTLRTLSTGHQTLCARR